jgi:hypothetical protein
MTQMKAQAAAAKMIGPAKKYASCKIITIMSRICST